ncbi:hypothetical protein B2A_05001, partial [mine drainage metagenome]
MGNIKNRGSTRGQSAVEYVITYSWAILIIGIIIGLLYFYGFMSLALRPTGCTINGNLYCEDSMLGMYTHNGAYVMGVLMTNTNQYPISNPTINVSYNGYNSGKAECIDGMVPPGGAFLCIVNLPTNKLSIGEYIKPTVHIQAGNCALSKAYLINGSCANATTEIFKGSAYGFIRYLPSDNLSISLAPRNANFAANGTRYAFKATITLFGYPLKGANVGFSSSNTIVSLSNTNVATAYSGYAYDYASSNYSSHTTITASYANVSTSASIYFRSPLMYSFADIVASNIDYISPIVLDNINIGIDNRTYTLGNLNKTGIVLLNGTMNNYTIQKSIEVNNTKYIFKNISSCGLSYTALNGTLLTCTQPSIKVYYEPVYKQTGSLYVADEGGSEV